MYIVFDVGGTKTRVAASADMQSFVGNPIVFDTHADLSEQVAAIAAAARTLCGSEACTAAAGGMKGSLDLSTGRTIRVPGKVGWDNQPIVQLLENALGSLVSVRNDTAMVGLGEAVAGAGQGSALVAYVTVSTGVNGVRIVDGNIDRASTGFEIGHQIIDFDGTVCPTCNVGSEIGIGRLEEYVGGAALERRTGQKPKSLTDPTVWETEARTLAIGLHNTILHWSPDVLVLGGSMITGDPAIPLEAVERHLKEIMWVFPVLPSIKKAALGDVGGLYGGLALLKELSKH